MMFSHIEDSYPTDGRDTVDPKMEAAQRTDSVRSIQQAIRRVIGRDRSLPTGYEAYLRQRVPSLRHIDELAPDVRIDAKGHSHGTS